MSRRVPIAVVLLIAALLAVAASAEPVRFWVVPPSGADVSSPGGAAPITIEPSELPEGQPAGDGDLGPLPQVIAVLTIAAGLAALLAMRGWWPAAWPSVAVRRRSRQRFESLPDVPSEHPGLDMEAARVALSTGEPRNAIVACWVRLESDIAAAGWPRSSSETSAEYVQRVVTESSVDPHAIAELAALYREARFSDHALLDADRAHARALLSRIEAGLRSGERVTA